MPSAASNFRARNHAGLSGTFYARIWIEQVGVEARPKPRPVQPEIMLPSQRLRFATIRSPSRVRLGRTAWISGNFAAISRAYPPVATIHGFRPLNSCFLMRPMISRTRPR